jgi:NDP-sugar pyrophosphorylase family protein
MKQLVIMCGGKCTRLKSLKNNLPKCLVKVGNKTLLQHQITLAKKHDFNEIILLTGYKSSLIKSFIKKKKLFNNIKVIKDKKNLGNGGALLNAYSHLDKNFCLIYCDILTNINLTNLNFFFKKNNCNILLVVNKNDNFKDSNLVTFNKKKIINNFYFYPHKKISTNSFSNEAIFLIKKDCLKIIRDRFFRKKTDFVQNLLPYLFYEKKINLHAYRSSKYIIDCGTLERLKKATYDFKNNLFQ